MIRNLLLFAFALLLLSCSSGKQDFDRGNYDLATSKAINRLRSNPEHKKGKSTLSKAYRMSVDYHLQQISLLNASQQTFRWEGIYSHYQSMNSIANDIRRCPGCLDVVPSPRFFKAEEEDARRKAAEARYNAGLAAMERGSREDAKEAYNHFVKAKSFQTSISNIDMLIEDARWASTVKVLFEKVPVYSQRFQVSDEYFTNKIFEFLTQNRRMNDFVYFFSPGEMSDVRLQNPNHVVRMQFDDFTVGQVYMQERVEQVSKDSVKVGQTTINGEKHDVYGTVKAKVSIFKKQVTSGGVLDLKIYDAVSNRILLQEKFPGEFVWFSEWGSFQGDERALNDAQKKICNSREVPPPAPDQLFIEFSRPIYDQVTNRVKNFYRNY
jgi:hypothetical protein